MNWLLPGFLAGGLLVGLPVALHFLRSRPKTEIRFPSLRFLGESALRDTRKHRLRRWLTLALRMLVILLLAGAFARPFWKNKQAEHQTAVLVAIDNSMSMQTGQRWEKLRQQALSSLDQLGPGDQAGLLIINPAPRWLVPMTADLATVRSTLQEMKPGFETTRYPAAMRLAAEALAAQSAHKKILVWMADEQRLGWLGATFDRSLPPDIEIQCGAIEPPPERQASITSTRWTPNPKGGTIELSIRLYSPASDERHIEVRSRDTVLATQNVKLAQNAENKVRLQVPFPANQTIEGLKVTMTPDALPADDIAWIVVTPPTSSKVLNEPPPSGTDFLAHALGSTHKLNDNPMEAVAFPESDWPQASVVIAQGGKPFSEHYRANLDRFAKGGGALWIFIDGSQEQRDWLAQRGIHFAERTPENDPWTLRDWDAESPLLSAFGSDGLFSLMDVEFYQGYDLTGDGITPVANWPDGSAAIASVSSGGQRFLICGFPPSREATDWMVRPSFVPFVHQAVRWLASLNSSARDWRIGEMIPLPSEKGTWKTIDSSTQEPPREVSGGVQPQAPGLYEYSDGKSRALYAVNTPVTESDLAPWPDADLLTRLQSQRPGVPAEQHSLAAGPMVSDEVAESQQRLWWWLLAACALGLLAEVALANRTSA
ncbi:N-terminal double-transmembrane domain-containing protein [Terrimicrobium sacchariphilum]|uniref:N-terminal double-transmembrane domain-containing protein n=1 Tax=Terrimicrobium sacchariphilum TaxID=690879 RepID=A0A146G8I6_TERSA|nr:BatA domain-containing protein [Terrimicrobium sacchariphilum]GAT33820.1 N-terminal double-transmembrane domain-containing protein [Terrimicrobium sacchariphilum]